MRILATICRLLVGAEFIFSGFVKVVDPYGTGLKLQEYFEVFSKDLPALAPIFHFFAANSLSLSLVFCCLEFILGFALLFSFSMKNTAWVTLLFMVFFTFLTFYSAFFNRVTDCGCFGDFFKLKPWDSFYKDVISLLLIGIIFNYRNKYKSSELGTPMVLISAVIAVGIGFYAIRYLPILEFLPYTVGKSIPEQMKTPNIKPIIQYEFEDKSQNKTIESNEFLGDTLKFKYISSKVLNQDEIAPKITDFSLQNFAGEDLTEKGFEGNKFFLIIKNNEGLENVDFGPMFKLANKAIKKKISTMVLTSLTPQEYQKIASKNKITYEVYNCDEKVLKTMARNNPVLILLQNGVIKGKWSFNNLPSFEKISELVSQK